MFGILKRKREMAVNENMSNSLERSNENAWLWAEDRTTLRTLPVWHLSRKKGRHETHFLEEIMHLAGE